MCNQRTRRLYVRQVFRIEKRRARFLRDGSIPRTVELSMRGNRFSSRCLREIVGKRFSRLEEKEKERKLDREIIQRGGRLNHS